MADVRDDTPPVALPFRFAGRPVRVTIATANTDTEVQHQTPDVPDGFLVLSSVGAISRAPSVEWTKDLAYLRSTVANDEALLVFVVLKEDPIDVNP